VIGEDWGKNAHNISVNDYLRIAGKKIVQIKYNALTSSTKIKQTILNQSQIVTKES
jgi:glycerol-3-phosphate cytidylyltransferase